MWQTPHGLALMFWGGLVCLRSLALLAIMFFVPPNHHSGYTGNGLKQAMAENKTKPTAASVTAFVNALAAPAKRADAKAKRF